MLKLKRYSLLLISLITNINQNTTNSKGHCNQLQGKPLYNGIASQFGAWWHQNLVFEVQKCI